MQIASRDQFQLAVSNPAFEFWYILHFECTTRPFSGGKELKNYLKRYYLPDYQPSMEVFGRLVGLIQTAIQNAESVLESHPQDDQRFPNPSTWVHLLVKKMIEMSPSGREHFR